MKKILKIAIGIGLILLFIGSVSAFEIDSLKTIDNYNGFQDKCATYTTNGNRFFFVEKVTVDDALKESFFENNTAAKFTVIPVDDNIFYFEDDLEKQYGYQEIVDIDGDKYMVSINQLSKLSPSEKNGFLDDLKEFNKVNNLKPVEI